jgi:hypothetical protein
MMQFQQWLTEMWLKHVDEYMEWYQTMPKYSMEEYFTQYQDWLKQQYKNESSNDND